MARSTEMAQTFLYGVALPHRTHHKNFRPCPVLMQMKIKCPILFGHIKVIKNG